MRFSGPNSRTTAATKHPANRHGFSTESADQRPSVAMWVVLQSRICPGQYLTDCKWLTITGDECATDAAAKPANAALTRNNHKSAITRVFACAIFICHPMKSGLLNYGCYVTVTLRLRYGLAFVVTLRYAPL
jgi:hypothetical protein